MHVVVTTDGSKQSLAAARALKSFTDPTKITEISVLAVIRPLAAVGFADDLSEQDRETAKVEALSFRAAADSATKRIAEVYDGWGPKVRRKLRSGSPAAEILKYARQADAGLIVIASGGGGVSDSVLMGGTAQRVQQYADCPVLVYRSPKRKRR